MSSRARLTTRYSPSSPTKTGVRRSSRPSFGLIAGATTVGVATAGAETLATGRRPVEDADAFGRQLDQEVVAAPDVAAADEILRDLRRQRLRLKRMMTQLRAH